MKAKYVGRVELVFVVDQMQRCAPNKDRNEWDLEFMKTRCLV